MRNGQDCEESMIYIRSPLRKLDPKSVNFKCLYGLVQSGKTSEICRAALISWFVYGCQPVIFVQNMSGRSVHGDQALRTLHKFLPYRLSKTPRPNFLSVSELMSAYRQEGVQKFLGWKGDHESIKKDLKQLKPKLVFAAELPKPNAKPRIKNVAVSKHDYVNIVDVNIGVSCAMCVPVLLANCYSAKNLRKQEVEKTVLDIALELNDNKNGNRYPVMLIYDEDDSNKSCHLATILPEHTVEQRAQIQAEIEELLGKAKDKNYSMATACKKARITKMTQFSNLFDLVDGELEPKSEKNQAKYDDDDDDDDYDDDYDDDGGKGSLRGSCHVMSVTATPIGTLLSPDNYDVLKLPVAKNYYGLGNQRISFETIPDICPDSVIERLVIPNMIRYPKRVEQFAYRHCLFFRRNISQVEESMSKLMTTLTQEVDEHHLGGLAFGVEYHGETKTENNVETKVSRIRVFINKRFFLQHKGRLEKLLQEKGKWPYRVEGLEMPDRTFVCLALENKLAGKGPGRKIPSIMEGMNFVSAAATIARENNKVALGFMGSLLPSNGRGVNNWDETFTYGLTEQLLPQSNNQIRLSRLVQALRVSGIRKSEARPFVWANEKDQTRLTDSFKLVEEVIRFKQELVSKKTLTSGILHAILRMSEDEKKKCAKEYPVLFKYASKQDMDHHQITDHKAWLLREGVKDFVPKVEAEFSQDSEATIVPGSDQATNSKLGELDLSMTWPEVESILKSKSDDPKVQQNLEADTEMDYFSFSNPIKTLQGMVGEVYTGLSDAQSRDVQAILNTALRTLEHLKRNKRKAPKDANPASPKKNKSIETN